MYLQITTRCNMTCEHCCFKCTSKGDDMSLDIVSQAIQLVNEYDGYLTLGGGEPTIHPKFRHILFECIAELENPLFCVTNGSVKKHALLLHKLSKKKIIDAHLSTDSFHEHAIVDDEVFEAFGYDDWNIENGNGPIDTGRWSETNDVPEGEGCACTTPLIQPNGMIRYCGCLNAPIIGSVWDGIDYPEYDCYKEMLDNNEN